MECFELETNVFSLALISNHRNILDFLSRVHVSEVSMLRSLAMPSRVQEDPCAHENLIFI